MKTPFKKYILGHPPKYSKGTGDMSEANIADLAVDGETCDPWLLVKQAIFAIVILFGNCSGLHFK